MKKILTLLTSIIILTVLTGCNIDCAERANPSCVVYPIFGTSSYEYVMHDTSTDTIKYVRIGDNGKIVRVYGSFTLDEYHNKLLNMITITLGDVELKTPIHWTKNAVEWHFYINNNRLMMFDKRDGETRQVFHFAELKPLHPSTDNDDIDHTRYVTYTNYITITNYVDVAKDTHHNIDFSFHD